MKDASAKRDNSELKAKSRALEEKDTTISAMSEQLTKATEYLASKKQVGMDIATFNLAEYQGQPLQRVAGFH